MNKVQVFATSPANARALRDEWIERLFQRFEDYYGAKWAAQYGDFPRDRVKRTWAEELGGFADKPEAIASALESQKTNPFPPTLPEFLMLCREAARRIGDNKPAPLALGHTLSDAEIAVNKARIAHMLAALVGAKAMPK